MIQKVLNGLGVILLLSSVGCKMPALIVAIEDAAEEYKSEAYNCEVMFITNKEFTKISDFESEYKREIIKKARDCKCDTLVIDINDVFNNQDTISIWGVCKSEKLAKKMAKKK